MTQAKTHIAGVYCLGRDGVYCLTKSLRAVLYCEKNQKNLQTDTELNFAVLMKPSVF